MKIVKMNEFTLCIETEKGFRFYNHKSQDFDLHTSSFARRFRTIEKANGLAGYFYRKLKQSIFVCSDVDGIVNTVG